MRDYPWFKIELVLCALVTLLQALLLRLRSNTLGARVCVTGPQIPLLVHPSTSTTGKRHGLQPGLCYCSVG